MKFPLLLVALLLLSEKSWACSCGPTPPPLKALALADAVFWGKVLKIDEITAKIKAPEHRIVLLRKSVTFDAIKPFKNLSDPKQITITTGNGMGDCGFPFEEGKTYLVYAYKDSGENLATDICTATHEADADDRDILELEHRLPSPPGEESPPSLKLKGAINDAGCNGYVFTLKNSLKQRVFFMGHGVDVFLAEVLIDGKWTPQVPLHSGTADEADSDTRQPDKLKAWKQSYDETAAESSLSYIDAGYSTPIFTVPQSSIYPWRIGMQYIGESELDSGRKLQSDGPIAWSEPIQPGQQAPNLSFQEAFEQK